MPLVSNELPSSRERPPWRGLVVGVVAAAVFIVVLAFVARATRDGAGGVVHIPTEEELALAAAALDAGPAVVDAGAPAIVDAGSVEDAGERATVENEDAGPTVVPLPPVDAMAVAGEVQPIVEKCLQNALRFDPSLGGKVHVDVEARAAALHATLKDAPSPVLATCFAENARALPFANAGAETSHVEVTLQLDGLRGQVKVVSAELVRVSAPE
jgi:hypothetical protein